jgi:ABC-type methionine transport system ATPase subunit
MSGEKYRLNYPAALINVPVIAQLVRKYDITVNILGAQIGDEEGWIEVRLAGDEKALSEALSWLGELGIQVQVISS